MSYFLYSLQRYKKKERDSKTKRASMVTVSQTTTLPTLFVWQGSVSQRDFQGATGRTFSPVFFSSPYYSSDDSAEYVTTRCWCDSARSTMTRRRLARACQTDLILIGNLFIVFRHTLKLCSFAKKLRNTFIRAVNNSESSKCLFFSVFFMFVFQFLK